MAQERQPHVRLVDLSTTAEQLAACGPDQTIARLTAALADDDTLLSVENAWQPWPLLAAAIAAARTELGTAAARLRVCFDPCNFAFIQEPTDAAAVLASLSPEQVGMLHFKQRRDGRLEPTVGAGDVDWPRLIPVIVARRLFGQALFEMAGHERLWHNLERSSAYLQACGDGRAPPNPGVSARCRQLPAVNTWWELRGMMRVATPSAATAAAHSAGS